jgi:hypothetical protein
MTKQIKINKNKGKVILALAIIGIVLLILIGLDSNTQNQTNQELNSIPADMREVTLYKDSNCGCCNGHTKMYEEAGFEVKVIESNDMDSIKEKYDISKDLQSCHTSIMGDYIIEGHVPLKGIKMLIEEMPNIKGIALPGMPIGTPGMPGLKTQTFQIRDIKSKEIIMEI